MAEQLRKEIENLEARINRLIMQGKERAADRLECQQQFLIEQLNKLIGVA